MSEFVDGCQSFSQQPDHESGSNTQQNCGCDRIKANSLQYFVPDVADRSSVNNSDRVTNAASRFTWIHDPQAAKNQKTISAASQLHVAKVGPCGCRRLQIWGLTLGT